MTGDCHLSTCLLPFGNVYATIPLVMIMAFYLQGQSVWQRLQETSEPIIMYGTGNGADKVLDIFEKLNIKIEGVTASSDFVRSRTFRGFPVMPISYFEEKFESFIVIITFGTSIPNVMNNIYKAAEKHTVLVPAVPVIGTEIFNECFYKENKCSIEKAYNLLADNFSKEIYEGYINFLYTGELSLLQNIETPEAEAFENILNLNKEESYVDIGAYRGDTVDTFLNFTSGSYKSIVCAEPDTKSFTKLMLHCEALNNFNAYNAAVTDVDGPVGFSDFHGRQSAVGGENTIKSVTLITLCKNIKPTYIKIDSEGCENQILEADGEILKELKPKLNIAAYHKFSDVFTLPILINSKNPEYKIHLRHHPYIPAWDTLFYCI